MSSFFLSKQCFFKSAKHKKVETDRLKGPSGLIFGWWVMVRAIDSLNDDIRTKQEVNQILKVKKKVLKGIFSCFFNLFSK